MSRDSVLLKRVSNKTWVFISPFKKTAFKIESRMNKRLMLFYIKKHFLLLSFIYLCSHFLRSGGASTSPRHLRHRWPELCNQKRINYKTEEKTENTSYKSTFFESREIVNRCLLSTFRIHFVKTFLQLFGEKTKWLKSCDTVPLKTFIKTRIIFPFLFVRATFCHFLLVWIVKLCK